MGSQSNNFFAFLISAKFAKGSFTGFYCIFSPPIIFANSLTDIFFPLPILITSPFPTFFDFIAKILALTTSPTYVKSLL